MKWTGSHFKTSQIWKEMVYCIVLFLLLQKLWNSIIRKLPVLIQEFAFSPISSQKNPHQTERMSTARFNCLQHWVINLLLDCFKQILPLRLSSLFIHLFITRKNSINYWARWYFIYCEHFIDIYSLRSSQYTLFFFFFFHFFMSYFIGFTKWKYQWY